MLEETLILFRNIRNPDYDKALKGYKQTGGFKALEKARAQQGRKARAAQRLQQLE